MRRCQNSSVCVCVCVRWLSCGMDVPGFEFLLEQEIILFSKTSIPPLGPTRSPNQWILAFLPQVLKLTFQINLAPRLRMNGAILPLPCMPSWRGQGQLYIYFYLYLFYLSGNLRDKIKNELGLISVRLCVLRRKRFVMLVWKIIVSALEFVFCLQVFINSIIFSMNK
jgi:hypothetical protein